MIAIIAVVAIIAVIALFAAILIIVAIIINITIIAVKAVVNPLNLIKQFSFSKFYQADFIKQILSSRFY